MLVSIGDEKKGGEPNENELEGENKHYVPVLYRGGKWYFCPGEKNGRLLKCSPDNLVRMLTVRDQKEVLLEALKEPFIPEQGDIAIDIEAVVSTTCGGFGYVNWLAICPTRAELQKFYFMPYKKVTISGRVEKISCSISALNMWTDSKTWIVIWVRLG